MLRLKEIKLFNILCADHYDQHHTWYLSVTKHLGIEVQEVTDAVSLNIIHYK